MKTIFDAFRKAILNDPKASRKDAFQQFLASVRANPVLIAELAETYFYQKAAQWQTQKVGKESFSIVKTVTAKQRQATSKTRTANAYVDIKAKIRSIVLLDMVLPNGKKLREATGAECTRAGGFYTEVARHIKPTEVVDKHLSEIDLQNIQRRYHGGNLRAA